MILKSRKLLGLFLASTMLMSSPIFTFQTFADEEDYSVESSEKEEVKTDEANEAPESNLGIQISPISNRITIKGGAELNHTLTVHNVGAKSFKYRLYVAPFSVANENYELDFSTQTNRTQISRWVTFKQEDGTYKDTYTKEIKPGEEQIIDYRVTTPENIPEGGQYATIFAEADDEIIDPVSGVKTSQRAGLTIYARTEGDSDDSAEIADFSLTRFLTEGDVTTSALVENNGNTDFPAEHYMIVKKMFGQVAYEKTQTYDILPDAPRRISNEWEETPKFGLFTVTSRVSALDKTYEETKLVLVIPLFAIIITIILLTFLVFWLIILIKKRRAQKAKLIV